MGKISDALERYSSDRSIKEEASCEQSIAKGGISGLREDLVSPPIDSLLEKLCVVSKPSSFDAERFKVLRSQILFPEDGKRPRLIMVTSAFPREGKTFVAANLAASIALGISEHVLAIDCDFRHPQLHHLLGCCNTEGLHEYLTGKRNLHELLLRTQIGKLSFLPAGRLPSNPTELVSSSLMSEFLEGVRDRYDDRYIIVDTAPSHITADAMVLAKRCDGVILVVKAYNGNRRIIQNTVDSIGKEKVLGVVFNGYNKFERQFHHYIQNSLAH